MSNESRLTEFEELYLLIERRISSEWRKRLLPLISESQATILWRLERDGPMKITTIADTMKITPGAVTSLADKLICSGYAKRERDEQDRRVVLLQITESGSELLCQYQRELKKAISEIIAGLPKEDIDHLVRIFQQVLMNLDRLG